VQLPDWRILRDIFTMGARPIAVLDSLRFGESPEQESRKTKRRTAQPRCVIRASQLPEIVLASHHRGEVCFGVAIAESVVNALALHAKRKRFSSQAKGTATVLSCAKTAGEPGKSGASLLASPNHQDRNRRPTSRSATLRGKALRGASKPCRLARSCDSAMGAAVQLLHTEIGFPRRAPASNRSRKSSQRETEYALRIMLSESQERCCSSRKWPRTGKCSPSQEMGLDARSRQVTDGGLMRVKIRQGRRGNPAHPLAEEGPSTTPVAIRAGRVESERLFRVWSA